MSFTELLSPDRIIIESSIGSKKSLFDLISQTLTYGNASLSANTLLKAFYQREALGTTGIGQQIAIPHARVEGITSPSAVFIKLENGINFASADNLPVRIVFAFVVPVDDNQTHLNIIASLASALNDATARKNILSLQDQQSLAQYLLTIKARQYA